MKIGDFVSKGLEAVSGGLFGGLSQKVNDKVYGVPTPTVRGGSEQGMDMRSYMDAAFPGTTPWERLGIGSSPMAGTSSDLERKTRMDMQKREYAQQDKITDKQNRTAVITSLGQVSPDAMNSGLQALTGKGPAAYDTQTQQAAARLQAEIPKLKADTALKLAEKALAFKKARTEGFVGDAQRKYLEFQHELLAAELRGANVKAVTNAINSVTGVVAAGKLKSFTKPQDALASKVPSTYRYKKKSDE